MKQSLFTLFALTLCLGHSSSTWAATPPPKAACIGSDPENYKIISSFTWRNKDPKFKPDFCDSDNLAYRMAKAVLFVKTVSDMNHGATDKFTPGALTPDAFRFFSARVKTITFEPDEGICSLGASAYVSGNDRVMHVCQGVVKVDDLEISSTLVHEARHYEGYLHELCNHGFFNGMEDLYACDSSFKKGGSYAIQAEYLVQVSRSNQIDPSIRQNARAQAIGLLVYHFNELPLGIHKGALLQSDDLEVHFYDGKTITPLHPLPDKNSRPYVFQDTLNFYDSARKAVTPVPDGINLGEVTTQAPFTEEGEKMFLDIFTIWGNKCTLFTNELNCMLYGEKLVLPIKDFTPVGFWTYPSKSKDNLMVGIVSDERQIHWASSNAGFFATKPAPALSAGDWNDSYVIYLEFNGKVSLVSKRDPAKHIPAPGIDQRKPFTKMITPYYWSKELQEL